MNLPVCLTRLLTLASCLVLLPVAAQARSALDGSLTVVNDRFVPVSVSVDQEPQGVVAPRSVRRFKDVPNGIRVIRLTSRDRHALVEHVNVPVGAVSTLKVAPQRGSATIENSSKVKMRLALNDRRLGTVAPGRSISTGLLTPGRYVVTATPLPRWADAAPIQEIPLMIRVGAETSAEIAPFFAGVRVENPTNRRLRILVDGKQAGSIGPRDETTVGRQIPGSHRLELRYRGRSVASAAVHLEAGEVRSWRPRIAHRGDLRLRNETGRRIRISVDGRFRGTLDPGEVRIVRDLPVGPTVVTSHGAGGWSMKRTVRVRPHKTLAVHLKLPVRRHHHSQTTTALYAH